MRYACLVYFDPKKVFNQSPEARAVLAAVRPHDQELTASGHLVMGAALKLPKDAMTVQVRDEAIPYEVPAKAELPARLESALQVVYLIFNEGYVATRGPSLLRGDLCEEAIRLGRLVVELL